MLPHCLESQAQPISTTVGLVQGSKRKRKRALPVTQGAGRPSTNTASCLHHIILVKIRHEIHLDPRNKGERARMTVWQGKTVQRLLSLVFLLRSPQVYLEFDLLDEESNEWEITQRSGCPS